MRTAILLILCALLLISTPAAAQIKEHAEVCFAGTGKFELDINFCSLAIRSRKHQGPSLATLFAHRGRAKSELGDLEGAVADFDVALTHNPASALSLNERGRARHKQGNNARAIADYDAALRLNPNYGAAYRNRGTARIHQGRMKDAIVDLDAAIASVNHDPASRILRGIARYLSGDFEAAIPDLSAALTQAYPYPEAVLWIYLAQRNAGLDAKAILARNASAMSEGAWPDPLIDVYLGEREVDSAITAANHSHEAIRLRRLTQAHFFLGALARLEMNMAKAKRHFETVLTFDTFDAIERAGAKLLLRWIQGRAECNRRTDILC
jgi:lipoprotein NlpI